MYDEKKVEDSLRICREIKTYYKSGVFDNPKNVFDLDTFLDVAETKVKEERKEKKTGVEEDAFQARLQEAIDYGNTLRQNRGREDFQKEERVDTTHLEKAKESVASDPRTEKQKKSKTKPAQREKTKIQFAEKQKEELTKQSVEKQKKKAKGQPAGTQKERKLAEKQKVKKQQKVVTQEEDEEEESFLKIMLSRFVELSICVIIAFGLSAAFNHYIGTHTIVEGGSMEGTLHDADSLYVDKISYQFGKPKRFDIIVFQQDKDNYYIKRIIGLPGETVEIKDGTIYINGNVLNENYGLENMDDMKNTFDAVTVGKNEYYVLGDNRNHSTDSRSEDVGLVKKSQIIGKATYRIYPFDTFGKIK